ncbi:MAG: hypothetical protein PHR19_04400 [Bacteroidales bacterium]|jgi:hypothetical protein|nr:hypothetical protein [Bacteroidales bacterium]HHT51737.1 hypothetical protein [Bacteroidales bacterium]
MKRLFFSTTLLICIIFAFGQNDVKKYYKYINKAELAICDFKYEKASNYYEKAFKTGLCFKNDLRNAFTVDYKYTEKEDNVLAYTHKLAQRGFSTPAIDTVKYSELYAQIKQVQDTTQIIYDPGILKQLDTLLIVDQSYRKNGFAYKKENRHVTDSLDLINYNKWLSFYEIEDEAVKQTLGIYFYRTPDPLLRHNIVFGRFPENILWDQVQNGYLDVRDYMEIYDIYIGTAGTPQQRAIYAKIPFGGGTIANKTFFGLYTKKDAPKLRKVFYLNSPKDELKKHIYQFYHGEKEFFLVPIKTYGAPCSEEDELELRLQYKEFENNNPKEYNKYEYIILTNPEFECG